MTAAFVEDTSAKKVNVGQGLYRTDEGTPFEDVLMEGFGHNRGRVA